MDTLFYQAAKGQLSHQRDLLGVRWDGLNANRVILTYVGSSLILKGHSYGSGDSNKTKKNGSHVLFLSYISETETELFVGQVSHFRYSCKDALDLLSYTPPVSVFIKLRNGNQVECFFSSTQFFVLNF